MTLAGLSPDFTSSLTTHFSPYQWNKILLIWFDQASKTEGLFCNSFFNSRELLASIEQDIREMKHYGSSKICFKKNYAVSESIFMDDMVSFNLFIVKQHFGKKSYCLLLILLRWSGLYCVTKCGLYLAAVVRPILELLQLGYNGLLFIFLRK